MPLEFPLSSFSRLPGTGGSYHFLVNGWHLRTSLDCNFQVKITTSTKYLQFWLFLYFAGKVAIRRDVLFLTFGFDPSILIYFDLFFPPPSSSNTYTIYSIASGRVFWISRFFCHGWCYKHIEIDYSDTCIILYPSISHANDRIVLL